ncbi:MAG TPA: transposase [Terriglobales bacterium]|nr:transposase [Terriglobales bacterium]
MRDQITDRNCHDTTQFKPLVKKAAETFDLQEVSADKAYSTYDNLDLIESLGGKPFIPFKSSALLVTTSHKGGSKVWTRLFHFFQMHREEFLEHYHGRSNVETAFSMLKRVIGDTLRSKHPVAQTNEALLMVICHNIRCRIHEAYELGWSRCSNRWPTRKLPEPPENARPQIKLQARPKRLGKGAHTCGCRRR